MVRRRRTSDTKRRMKGQPNGRAAFREPRDPDYIVYGKAGVRNGAATACERAEQILDADDDPDAVVEVRMGTKKVWKLLCQISKVKDWKPRRR